MGTIFHKLAMFPFVHVNGNILSFPTGLFVDCLVHFDVRDNNTFLSNLS